MREAIANANIFNIVIVFTILLLMFFVGSLSYTKAFKVKNGIVNQIEKDEGWFEDKKNNSLAKVEDWLLSIGYRTSSTNSCSTYEAQEKKNCSSTNPESCYKLVNNKSKKYDFCVFKKIVCNGLPKNFNLKDSYGKCSTRYKVIAFMYFDMPIIGGLVKVPVSGETVSFTELYG